MPSKEFERVGDIKSALEPPESSETTVIPTSLQGVAKLALLCYREMDAA